MRREIAYTALFDLLQTMNGVTTFGRVLPNYDDVSSSFQPALYLTLATQEARQTKGMPTIYALKAKLWMYAHRDTNGEVPSIQINNFLDQLDAILAPNPTPDFTQTLSGKVLHCFIDGVIETFEGTLGNQEIAVVPITMQVTT